jgi:hypothetical protein
MMFYTSNFSTDGQAFDLGLMPREHRDFLTRAYWHYCMGMQYEEFVAFTLGPNSPVLDPKKNGPVPLEQPFMKL